MSHFEYPLNPDWSTEEIVTVIEFLASVEQAYTKGVPLAQLTQRYQAFKYIVTSIGEEKRLDRHFQEVSGYSIYRVVQQMKASSQEHGPQSLVRIK